MTERTKNNKQHITPNHSLRSGSGRADDGFTLLEVLLTVVLLAFGLTMLLQALSTGIFASGTNESELVAVNLAQEKMEEIKNSSYANVGYVAKGAVSGFSAFLRGVDVETPQTGLKMVTVTVYWYAKGTEMSLDLVTYVSNVA